MTVLVDARAHEARRRRHDPAAGRRDRRVVGRAPRRREADRSRADRGGADPERERRRGRARPARRARQRDGLRGADEREGEAARPHAHALRESGRARRDRPRTRARGTSRSSRRPSMREPLRAVGGRASASRAITGRTPAHLERPARRGSRALIGVKTGHTSDAGWSEVAAAQGNGVTVYATLLGEPGRVACATTTSRSSSPGGWRGTGSCRSSRPAVSTGPRSCPGARSRSRSSRRGRSCTSPGWGGAMTERVVTPDVVVAARPQGTAARERERLRPRQARRPGCRSSPTARSRARVPSGA